MDLFHVLGKVLYSKRVEGEGGEEVVADGLFESEELLMKLL